MSSRVQTAVGFAASRQKNRRAVCPFVYATPLGAFQAVGIRSNTDHHSLRSHFTASRTRWPILFSLPGNWPLQCVPFQAKSGDTKRYNLTMELMGCSLRLLFRAHVGGIAVRYTYAKEAFSAPRPTLVARLHATWLTSCKCVAIQPVGQARPYLMRRI